MIIYNAKIKKIGSKANDFKRNNMIILFGEIVPDELEPYCYIVEMVTVTTKIKVNDFLLINNREYIITAVGEKVERNLQELGHITIDFNGNNVPDQGGTLYIEKKDIVNIKLNNSIQIVRKENKE